MKRSLLFAACFVGVSVISSEALAFEKFTVGAGLMGAIGGSFQNKPGNRVEPPPPNGRGIEDTTYPGFGGFNGPMPGIFIEGRALGIVGLEIDFLFQNDRAHGDVTLNGNTFKVDIGQKALHIPVLLKATLPSPLFAPAVFIGPEFVRPDGGTVTVESSTGVTDPYTRLAKADNYTMLTMGLGGEFKLPLPKVDIRIPFSLRGSIQPGFSDTLSDRAKYENLGGKITYNTAWRYQALATLGAAVHF